MSISNHTFTVASTLCVVMLLLAGCSTVLEEERRPTTVEASGTTTIAEETGTTERQTSETTTEQPTTTIDYTRGLPYELWIANNREEKTEVSIRIEADNGTAIYNDTITISGNTTEEYNLSFPEAGSYEIIASTDTNTDSSPWRIVSKDPDGAASVVLAKDGDLHVSVVMV